VAKTGRKLHRLREPVHTRVPHWDKSRLGCGVVLGLLVAQVSSMSGRINIWFPFYVGDYRAETQGFSHEERGIYVDLLCAYCHRQAPLPDDDKALAKLAGVSLPKWRGVRKVIGPVFTVSQGVWRLPRLDEQIAHGLEVREKRRRAGQVGGRRSWEKRQANASANASDESKQMLNKSQSQSQFSTHVLDPDGGLEGRLASHAAKAGGE